MDCGGELRGPWQVSGGSLGVRGVLGGVMGVWGGGGSPMEQELALYWGTTGWGPADVMVGRRGGVGDGGHAGHVGIAGTWGYGG